MIKAKVTAASIAVTADEKLTSGRVGLECEFEFSPEWEGLAKTVVFEGVCSRAIVLTGSTAVIPPETLDDAAGCTLRVAATGASEDGTIVIPTVWGKVGVISASVADSEYSESHWQPTPDIAAQVMNMAGNAEYLAQQLRLDANNGVFNGRDGERGERGERGEQGIQGERGERGERGEQGIQGERGERGEPGQGSTGPLADADKPAPVYPLPYLTSSDLGTSVTADFLRELCRHICAAYPNVGFGTWLGCTRPNGIGFAALTIQSTAAVNASGCPQRCAGLYRAFSDNSLVTFSFSNYVFSSEVK